MGLSTALLIVAVMSAVVAAAVTTRVRGFALRLMAVGAVGAVVTAAGLVLVRRSQGPLEAEGVTHAVYLALVVSFPVALLLVVVDRVRRDRSRLSRWPERTAVLGALVALGVGVYATHLEPRWLRVDHHELAVADVENPLRVAVLADVQNDRIGAHEQRALDLLLDEDPDLLLVPGDLWQMENEELETRWLDYRAYVERMVAGAPAVVLVVGDGDHLGWLERIAEGTGAHVLGDDIVEFVLDGQPVRVGGVTLRSRLGATPQQYETARDLGVDADDAVTVLVSHRPAAVYDVTPGAVDLVVAGHTHGGQVAIPFYGPPSHDSAVPRSVAAGGLHEVNDTAIYVSTGVGMRREAAPQVRFGVRPSVGIIDLVPADSVHGGSVDP